MTARVATVAFAGIDVLDIDVQVQMAHGLPSFAVVGLPDKAVAESRERVRAALSAMGLALPPKRITVNLAPADLAKEGSHFDLPIALGLLTVLGGGGGGRHLRLSGPGRARPRRRHRPGHRRAAGGDPRQREEPGLICPAAQGGEAAWSAGSGVLAAPSLLGAASTTSRATQHPGAADAPARERTRSPYPGPCRRQGPGDGKAGTGDRRGRRPQHADVRAAGLGQVDARPRACRASCRRSTLRRRWKSRLIHSVAGTLEGRQR